MRLHLGKKYLEIRLEERKIGRGGKQFAGYCCDLRER